MATEKFDAVLRRTLADSGERRQQTIDGLVAVLKDLKAKGTRTYTVAVVGRACQDAGVLNTQSIRNAAGASYRALIEAFAKEVGAGTSHTPPVRQTPLEEAIATIADKDIRTRLRALLAEVKGLRNERDTLSAAFKRVTMPSSPATAGAGAAITADEPAGELLPPTQFDLAPLAEFISERWIDRKGWVVDDQGALRDEEADRLTPNGFVPALQTALDRLGRGAV